MALAEPIATRTTTTVGEGKAENGRFHPVRTSFPVVMLVFQLEDDRETVKIKLKP